MERTTSTCAIEPEKKSTFKVGGGDGEVIEGEAIKGRTTDEDNDGKNTQQTTKKTHNNQIMRSCDGNGHDHDHEDDNDVANSNDDDCDDDEDDGSGDGDGGGVGDSDGGGTDNNQLKLQKQWRLQLGNGWATAQRQ